LTGGIPHGRKGRTAGRHFFRRDIVPCCDPPDLIFFLSFGEILAYHTIPEEIYLSG